MQAGGWRLWGLRITLLIDAHERHVADIGKRKHHARHLAIAPARPLARQLDLDLKRIVEREAVPCASSYS